MNGRTHFGGLGVDETKMDLKETEFQAVYYINLVQNRWNFVKKNEFSDSKKWILKKCDVIMWTGLIWLRIGCRRIFCQSCLRPAGYLVCLLFALEDGGDYFLTKYLSTSTRVHGVTPEKIVLF
jgi:hypothetical protein